MAADSQIDYFIVTVYPSSEPDQQVFVKAHTTDTGEVWENGDFAGTAIPLETTLENLAVDMDHSFGL